jgi:hypothetical protein
MTEKQLRNVLSDFVYYLDPSALEQLYKELSQSKFYKRELLNAKIANLLNEISEVTRRWDGSNKLDKNINLLKDMTFKINEILHEYKDGYSFKKRLNRR